MPYSDPEKQRTAQREWARRNKDTIKRNNLLSRARKREVIEAKKAVGCMYCDEVEPCALDLHHRDPSTKSFELGRAQKRGLPAVIAELEKCDVLCANCHRKLHAGLL